MSKIARIAYPAVAALALFSALSAHAEGPIGQYSAQELAPTNRTLAQAQAEYLQAKADGSLRVWSTSYNPFAAVKSVKTRAEVRAEVLAGGVDIDGEDSGSFAFSQQSPARSAAPLVAAATR